MQQFEELGVRLLGHVFWHRGRKASDTDLAEEEENEDAGETQTIDERFDT